MSETTTVLLDKEQYDAIMHALKGLKISIIALTCFVSLGIGLYLGKG